MPRDDLESSKGQGCLPADTPPAMYKKEMMFGTRSWICSAKLKGRVEKGETVGIPG